MLYSRKLKNKGIIFPKNVDLKYLKYLMDLGNYPVVKISYTISSKIKCDNIVVLTYSTFNIHNTMDSLKFVKIKLLSRSEIKNILKHRIPIYTSSEMMEIDFPKNNCVTTFYI